MSTYSPPTKRFKPESNGKSVNGSMGHNSNNISNGMEIDEGLYSRQLYVMGTEAMKHMSKSNVLISGLNGLGLEVAKNVILAGVQSVTLHDCKDASLDDLSSHYYFNEQDIGANKAEISLNKLCELNSYVDVMCNKENISKINLNMYNVVVLCDHSYDTVTEISSKCHSQNIKLIYANTGGLFGQIFCDFGEAHKVHDINGEEPLSVIIENISNGDDGIVKCLEEAKHGFEDGDYVKFQEVKGMIELNNIEPRKIKVIDPFTFSVGNTKQFSIYESGGVVSQVKMPIIQSYLPFDKALKCPKFADSDFAKSHLLPQLHIMFQAIDSIKANNNLNNYEKFQNLVMSLKDDIYADLEIDNSLLEIFPKAYNGNLAPIQSIIGGIAGQEVLKACSGKFNPIQQFFYFDAVECYPTDVKVVNGDQKAINNNVSSSKRHDAQISIFGEEFQNKLANASIFVVGAGAIGCELLKNFAMIGLGEGSGKIVVTDMDTIEKSNLNRQFLFRQKDIGQLKSKVAGEAAKQMNSNINIESLDLKVGKETETYFNDEFFSGINVVANALDNVDARLYMDRRCVYYGKPLLESGTLGTKGNIQVVVPKLTESYGSSVDPPEKAIPVCTLKNFPYEIEHTIQWARDLFEGVFTSTSLVLEDAKKSKEKFRHNLSDIKPETLLTINFTLKTPPKNFKDCLLWARGLWHKLFYDDIKQLLHNFPPDAVTSMGSPFWYGTKRCPKELYFNVDNDTHSRFVYSAAAIYAIMLSIQPIPYSVELMKESLNDYVIPEFQVKSMKIAITDAEIEQQNRDNAATMTDLNIEILLKSLETFDHTVNEVEFEKDIDENCHIDFVTATSNLRAKNYDIEPADRLKTKKIAGKIIPAIATTTGLVAGLVTLELYKIIQGNEDIERYKNAFINLALPFFGFSEPIPPPKFGFKEHQWTLWDKIEVNHPMTLQQLIDFLEEKFEVSVAMLSQDVAMIFGFFQTFKTKEANLQLTIPQLIEKITKKPIPTHCKSLILEASVNLSDDDVDIPYIQYNL